MKHGKRGLLIALGFFLGILLLVTVSAYEYACDFRSEAACQTDPWDNIVLRVWSSTNAHGATYADGSYNKVVCCNWTASATPNRDCSTLPSTNLILNLSAITNAHAAVPLAQGAKYMVPICYEDLECINTLTGSCNANYPMKILTLSGATNAHLGNETAYSSAQTICCTNPNEPAPTQTCSAQGGSICDLSLGESCGGNVLSATDTSGNLVCCDESCTQCIPKTPVQACLTPSGRLLDCGSVSDGCGGLVDCGSCSASEACSGNTCVDNTACTIGYSQWDRNYTVEGTEVSLEVFVSPLCSGTQVSFEIFEKDTGSDQTLTSLGGYNPDPVTVTAGGVANGSWISEWHDDAGGIPEYYFKAHVGSVGETTSDDPLLEVDSVACDLVTACDDFTTQYSCEATQSACMDDVIAYHEAQDPDITSCNDQSQCNTDSSWFSCGCVWQGSSPTEGSCHFASTKHLCDDPAQCGNGELDSELGEVCDGSAPDGSACTDYDAYTGGTLGCFAPGETFECQLDYSSCEGGSPGSCGDGVINAGEDCDGINITLNSQGNATCEYLGYDYGGELGCTSACRYDVSSCYNEPTLSTFEFGTCIKGQGPVVDCDHGLIGFYQSSWTGVWSWGHGGWTSAEACRLAMNALVGDCVQDTDGRWYYDPDSSKTTCTAGGQSTIECGAEIKLPFFDFRNVVLVLLLMGLIYVFKFYHEHKKVL